MMTASKNILTVSLEEQDNDGCSANDDAGPQEGNSEEKVEGDCSTNNFSEVGCSCDYFRLDPEQNSIVRTKTLAKEAGSDFPVTMPNFAERYWTSMAERFERTSTHTKR